MNKPPQLTSEQRAEALRRASASRKARSLLKAQVKSGELGVGQVLAIAATDPVIGKMRVVELLESLPGVGKIRAANLMRRISISPTRRIQGLGVHQIAKLGAEFTLSQPQFSRGRLLVLSGPGGVGKSTVATQLRERNHFWVSVSATTRPARATENNGVDYFFLSNEEFDRRIAQDDFLEWAQFAGNRYGTPRRAVEEAMAQGHDVLLEIEIEGARQVRQHSKEAILVFLMPPSWEDLVGRLAARGSDSQERRAQRLELAQREMAVAPEFDHVIVNDSVERVVQALVALAR
ncbi:MAG: guanylate kinase [Actinobacteria bacterium]|nr:guanylate kinase [Actinomycetota bacterium]